MDGMILIKSMFESKALRVHKTFKYNILRDYQCLYPENTISVKGYYTNGVHLNASLMQIHKHNESPKVLVVNFHITICVVLHLSYC